MKLKQEDRNLLHDFFTSQQEWMKNNSLRTFENLSQFKKRFLEFTKVKNCEDNIACKLFALTLELELLKCEERNLIQLYNEELNRKKIKRAKLNYRPVTQVATDNPSILEWVKEASIAYEVPASHMEALDRSIEQKLKQNEAERRASYEAAKDLIVR